MAHEGEGAREEEGGKEFLLSAELELMTLDKMALILWRGLSEQPGSFGTN